MENFLNTAITKKDLDKYISKQLNLYQPFFISLSGAHIYGFASKDSDLDIRGSYYFDKDTLFGLWNSKFATVQAPIETINGIELDLVCHEISKYVGMIFSGENGYVLEQVFSPVVIYQDEKFEHFKKIIKNCYITKKLFRHYNSFAKNKIEEFRKQEEKKLKTILYAFRVAHTGIHIMKTGEIVTNLKELNEGFENHEFINELITRKTEEQSILTNEKEAQDLIIQAESFVEKLQKAHEESTLPEIVRNRYKLEREVPVFYCNKLFDRCFALPIMKSPYDRNFIDKEKQRLILEAGPLASLEEKLEMRILPKKHVYVPDMRKFFTVKNRKDHGRKFEFVDIERFIVHLLKSNPFSLLALYQPDDKNLHPVLKDLKSKPGKLISKSIYKPFKGIAASYFKSFTSSDQSDYDPAKVIAMLSMLIHGRYALEKGTIGYNYSHHINFLKDVASKKATKDAIIDKYKKLLESYEKAWNSCKLPLEHPDRKYLVDHLASIKTSYWLSEE